MLCEPKCSASSLMPPCQSKPLFSLAVVITDPLMNNPWIQVRAEHLVPLSALMSCRGEQKKVDSWLLKSLFSKSEDQKDRSAMREQFEAILFSCKHRWNDSSLLGGWGTTWLSACQPQVCVAQPPRAAAIQKKDGEGGWVCAGLGLRRASERAPDSAAKTRMRNDAGTREEVLAYVYGKLNWDHICSASKKAVFARGRGEGGVSRKSNYKTIRGKRCKMITLKMGTFNVEENPFARVQTTVRNFY